MKNLIEQLKKNRYPFGMWPDPECYGKELGEAMQAKAREIGLLKAFRLFVGPGWGGIFEATGCKFRDAKTYCLRADYEDEPEIVEYKIISGGCTAWMDMLAYIDGRCVEQGICEASAYLDFIGFKFADGQVANRAVAYFSTTHRFSGLVHIDQIKDGSFKVLHATHVLFRRKKQE